MSIEQLGSLGEFIAAVATVATLIYLAMQLRANTRATRALVMQNISDAAQGQRLFWVEHPEVLQLLIRARSGPALADHEQMQVGEALGAIIDWHQNAWFQHQTGQLDATTFAARWTYIGELLDSEGTAAWWAANRHYYRPDFVTAVETALTERDFDYFAKYRMGKEEPDGSA